MTTDDPFTGGESQSNGRGLMWITIGILSLAVIVLAAYGLS